MGIDWQRGKRCDCQFPRRRRGHRRRRALHDPLLQSPSQGRRNTRQSGDELDGRARLSPVRARRPECPLRDDLVRVHHASDDRRIQGHRGELPGRLAHQHRPLGMAARRRRICRLRDRSRDVVRASDAWRPSRPRNGRRVPAHRDPGRAPGVCDRERQGGRSARQCAALPRNAPRVARHLHREHDRRRRESRRR